MTASIWAPNGFSPEIVPFAFFEGVALGAQTAIDISPYTAILDSQLQVFVAGAMQSTDSWSVSGTSVILAVPMTLGQKYRVDVYKASPVVDLELPPQLGEGGNVLFTNGTNPFWAPETKELPLMLGNAGKVLTNDGTIPSWQANIPPTPTTIYYTSPGVGAIARSLYNKEIERGFSVLDFGAVPDADYAGNGTDSTAAFQAAIQAAWAAANTSGTTDFGGRVYIPAGNYKITGTLLLHPMVALVGDGKYITSLIIPASFNKPNGVIYSNANTLPYSGAASLPNAIVGLNVSTVTGGLIGISFGLYLDKNSTFVRDVWVSGFLNGGSGIVVLNTDIFVEDFVVEYCTYGVNVLSAAVNVRGGTAYLCDYGVLLDNAVIGAGEAQPVIFSDIRANNCNFTGFKALTNSRRASFVNCSASHINKTKFGEAGFMGDGAIDLTIVGFRAILDIANTNPSNTAYGVYLKNCTAVTVSGGIAKGWKSGYVAEGGANVAFDGVDGYGNRDRGAWLNGGDQHQITSSVFASNGIGGGLGIGIETVNSGANSTHQILGCSAQGAPGGTQTIGVNSTLVDNGANTGQTIIGGGTACYYNTTANYQLAGVLGRIFTEGSYPTSRAFQTVASATVITIPASAANGGAIFVTGSTMITDFAAGAFEGGSITLVSQGTFTVKNGTGNLRVASDFAMISGSTLTLRCTSSVGSGLWHETGRKL